MVCHIVPRTNPSNAMNCAISSASKRHGGTRGTFHMTFAWFPILYRIIQMQYSGRYDNMQVFFHSVSLHSTRLESTWVHTPSNDPPLLLALIPMQMCSRAVSRCEHNLPSVDRAGMIGLRMCTPCPKLGIASGSWEQVPVHLQHEQAVEALKCACFSYLFPMICDLTARKSCLESRTSWDIFGSWLHGRSDVFFATLSCLCGCLQFATRFFWSPVIMFVDNCQLK